MSGAEEVTYLIVHMCSRAVLMHVLFSLEYYAPYRCRRPSLIWVRWIILLSIQKGCVRVSSVVWGRKRSVPCVCFIRFITEWIALWMSINHFVTARNTWASADLGELALVIPRCRTNAFNRSFQPAPIRLWNLLSSGMFSGNTLSFFFKSAMNFCLLRVQLYFFLFISVFLLFYSLLDIAVLGQFWFTGISFFLILCIR